MKRFITIVIGLLLSITSIALYIIFNNDKKEEIIEPTINTVIAQNISLPFYKSNDNRPLFGSNGFWDSSKPNTPTPEEVGGNYDVIYGDITDKEKMFLQDLLKVYDMASKKLTSMGVEVPPLWWYLGVALSESGGALNMSGLIMPPMIPLSSFENYKQGDLLKIPNPVGSKYVGNKPDGIFQIENDNYVKDYFGLDPYAIPNQFVWAALHAQQRATSPEYKRLSKDEYWILKSTSHMADASKQFPVKDMDYWLPVLKSWLSVETGNVVINVVNTYGRNSKETNKVFPALLLYQAIKVKGVENINIKSEKVVGDVATGSNSKTYLPTTSDKFIEKYIKDIWQVVPPLKSTSNGVQGKLIKKWKNNYVSSDSFPNIAIDRNGQQCVTIRSHAGSRHLLQTYHYGRYLEQAINVMLNPSKQASPKKTKMIDNPITPSIYYTEYQQLEDEKSLKVHPDVVDYNNLKKEDFEPYLPKVEYTNQYLKSYSGQLEEVGWKGDYPIFAQSDKNISGKTPIKFNGQDTTLTESGCSIYALTSLIHKQGLGRQSIPNDLNNKGLTEDKVITPSSLSKVITAPVTPYKISELGYDVKQLPTNTPDDIRKMMKEVENGTPYIVNVRSGKVKAVDGFGNIIDFSFTDSGHFILITGVHHIKGRTYFEVVDSNYNYPNQDSNRLLFDLEDAIAKDIFKSSSGVPVPAVTITGIKNNTTTLYGEIKKSIDDKGVYTLQKEALIIPENGRTVIYYDNYNPIVVYKEGYPNETGIYGVGTTVLSGITIEDIYINNSPIQKENIGGVSKGGN